MNYSTLIEEVIQAEKRQLLSNAIMIGSANMPFIEVARASILPFNYNPIEGFMNQRISPGCAYLDNLEAIGVNLAEKFFAINSGDFHISFNPISGTLANQIVYNAMLSVGDTILVMDIFSGGHISHFYYPNKFFNVLTYGVDKKEEIDYAMIDSLCKKYKPKLLVTGSSCYPKNIAYDVIFDICQQHSVLHLADISHKAIYLSLSKENSPFNFSDFITVTTHKTLKGPRSALLFSARHYEHEIQHSIYPLTQSAPRYTDILCKVVMLNELLKFDVAGYISNILKYSKYFLHYMQQKNIPVFSSETDSHLIILKLPRFSEEIKKNLEKVGVLADICFLPTDTHGATGLRFGTLMMAFLDVSMDDFNSICEIIYNVINNSGKLQTHKINDIIHKYASKFVPYFDV